MAAPNIDFNDALGSDTDDSPPGDLTPVVPAEPSEALVLANVGDSRTYLFRHGRLRRVTVDHSYVQELVATGHITEAEARDHPRRNIITRALGIEPEVRVDWWTLPLISGDRFLLCSDGLVDEVDEVDIAATLTLESDPQVAADRLVDKANEAGGRDNITVVVVDVLEGDDPPDPTQELDLVPVWADGGTDPDPGRHARTRPRPHRAGRDHVEAPVDEQAATCAASGRSSTLAIGFAIAAVLVDRVRGVLCMGTWRMVRRLRRQRRSDHLPRAPRWRAVDRPDRGERQPARRATSSTPTSPRSSTTEPRFDSFDDAFAFINSGTTTTTTTTTTVPPTTRAADDDAHPTPRSPEPSAPGGVTTTSGP